MSIPSPRHAPRQADEFGSWAGLPVEQLTTAAQASLSPVEKAEYASRIRKYLAGRRAREDILRGEWFGDPAWDILLDLLASSYESRHVSIGSACIAAAVPQTTALRWVNRLVDAGALLRRSDPCDGRRNYLMLEPALAARLELWVTCHLMPPNSAPRRAFTG